VLGRCLQLLVQWAVKGEQASDSALLRVCWKLEPAGKDRSADRSRPQAAESREPSSQKHGQHGDGKPTAPRVGPVGGGKAAGGPGGTHGRRRGLARGFKRPQGARPRDAGNVSDQLAGAPAGPGFENSCRSIGPGPNLQVPADAQTAATAGGLLIVALAQQGRDASASAGCPRA